MSEPARLSWIDALRVQLWLRRLDRPVVARDRARFWVFFASLALYWLVGQILHQFRAHDVDNLLFGGDISRVWSDLARSHRQPTSGIAVSSAHPLFVFFLHPVASLLSRILGGADLMASLILCHVAAALGNLFLYMLLRRGQVSRPMAVAVTVAAGLSTAQLIFGSTTETYSFIPAATLGLALLAVHTRSVLPTAAVALLPFALNLTLLPYTLFCAPVVWLGRLRFRRWLPRVLGFWLAVVVLGLAALLYQHVQYPETNFFDPGKWAGYYEGYVHKPVLKDRTVELGAHFFGFSVVGPKPHFFNDSSRQAFFVHNEVASYSTLGWIVVGLWALLWLSATYANLRSAWRMGRERLALVVLSGGWVLGSYGFFLFYGCELFLPAEYWTVFLLLWLGQGLGALVTLHPSTRRALAGTGLLALALFAANQAHFVWTFVRNYYDGPLLLLTGS